MVNPGGTFCRRTKLRTSSPAPMTSIRESASSETTSRLRRRCRRRCRPPSLCPLRPPAFSEVLRSTLTARQTGARPNKMPVASEMANVNAATVALISISSRRGMLPGFMARTTERLNSAMARPAAPPRIASRILSVSNCRTIRCQPAPRAVRMATSFSRPAARVSSRLATLAQAISSTSVTEPTSTSSARRTSPTTCSCSPTMCMPKVGPRLSFSRMRLAMASISACACGIETPGLRRTRML